MGWCGHGEHEGWVQMVFTDGTFASGTSTALGIYAEGYGYIGEPGNCVEDPSFLRPWSAVAAWRMACECGWRGDVLLVPNDGRQHPEPTEAEEDALLLPAWQSHVAPFRAIEDLADIADEWRALDERLTGTVRRARSVGASWSDIGRELGLTKQGAQQRYADV